MLSFYLITLCFLLKLCCRRLPILSATACGRETMLRSKYLTNSGALHLLYFALYKGTLLNSGLLEWSIWPQLMCFNCSPGSNVGEAARAAAGRSSHRTTQQCSTVGGAVVVASVGRDYVSAAWHRAPPPGHPSTENTNNSTPGAIGQTSDGSSVLQWAGIRVSCA